MRVPKYLNVFISLNTQLYRASFPSVSTHKKTEYNIWFDSQSDIGVFGRNDSTLLEYIF